MLTTRERRELREEEKERRGRKTTGRKGSRGKGRRMGVERSMVGKKDEVKGLTDLNGGKNKQKPQPNTHAHTHTHTILSKFSRKQDVREFSEIF